MEIKIANSVDLDKMPHFAASYLGYVLFDDVTYVKICVCVCWGGGEL